MNIMFVCALKEESDGQDTLFDFPIIHTGVGKINAGYKTALGIIKHKPDLVCNFGSCGSFTMEKGMLLKVKDVYNGDMDAEPLVPYSITPFDQDGDYLQIETDGVSCFTTETFITREKVDNFTPKKLELLNKCSIFEMELYSITRVCKEFNIPIVSYKWVSDDGSMNDWEENCRIGYSQFKLEFYNKYIAG